MHRNHRRKAGRHNPKKEGGGHSWNPPSLIPWRKRYWREYRAAVRKLMHHERYDAIRDRHPATIMWDFY